MIKNEPEKYVGDYEVDAVRSAYENRGNWYYYMVKEGLDKGLPLQFARDAMHESGKFLARTRFKDVKTMQDFEKEFMTYGVTHVNEGETVRLTDDEFEVDLHYCPLVHAWQKLTDDEEYMARICDVCMDMDRGTAESLGWKMDLKATIAGGCGKCTMCFKKK